MLQQNCCRFAAIWLHLFSKQHIMAKLVWNSTKFCNWQAKHSLCHCSKANDYKNIEVAAKLLHRVYDSIQSNCSMSYALVVSLTKPLKRLGINKENYCRMNATCCMLHACCMNATCMLHAAFLNIFKLLLIKFLGCNHPSYQKTIMISNNWFSPVIANSGSMQHICRSFAI